MDAATQIREASTSEASTGPEPWLRGALPDVHPLVMPVFFSFQQVREDLRKHLQGMTLEKLWQPIGPVAAVGFHLKHIAGSVDRLSAYLSGQEVSQLQLDFLKQESVGDADLDMLLQQIEVSLNRAEQVLRSIDARNIYDSRTVGRDHLPTTAIGLIVHLAEHTQRHLGQAITTAKLVQTAGIG